MSFVIFYVQIRKKHTFPPQKQLTKKYSEFLDATKLRTLRLATLTRALVLVVPAGGATIGGSRVGSGTL